MTINIKGFDIIKHINMCVQNEQCYNYNFNSDNYKIELGIAHINKIIEQLPMFPVNNKDTRMTIMGMPLEVNYENPYEFKMWRDVTLESQVIM